MRILITGSNGLLGQYLAKLLLQDSVDFLATSKGTNQNTELPKSQYRTLDICNPAALQEVFKSYRPSTVINTAALTNVDICEQQKEKCWHVNVQGVENLIKICEQYGTHLVQLSTDFVFDGTKKTCYKENDPTHPVNYYGKSKEAAENLLLKSRLEYWSIVRTIVVYGYLPKMSRSNLILWVKENLEKKQSIHVVKDQYRMPTYAADLAKGCLSVAQRKAKGIFHLCGKESMSILQVAQRVARFFDLDANLIQPVRSEFFNQAAKRPPRTAFDLKNAQAILKYEPLILEKSLQEMKKNCTLAPCPLKT